MTRSLVRIQSRALSDRVVYIAVQSFCFLHEGRRFFGPDQESSGVAENEKACRSHHEGESNQFVSVTLKIEKGFV